MATRARTWAEMRADIVGLLERRTGEGVDAWNARIGQRRPANEAELRAWLSEQAV